MILEHVEVTVSNGSLDEAEIKAYIAYIRKNHPSKTLKRLHLALHGEEIDLQYEFQAVPFERIRRITGYLVGTVDRFNDAKRAEERDRIKHA